MPLSMHQASVPLFVRQLGVLSTLLTKGEAFAEGGAIAASALIDARLAPDMHPLSRQVQIASDAAKGACARLADVEVPSFADTESSFAQLRDRVAKTIGFVEGIAAERFDGSETRIITLKAGASEFRFAGQQEYYSFPF